MGNSTLPPVGARHFHPLPGVKPKLALLESDPLFSYQFRGDLRDLPIDWQAEQSKATADRIIT